MAPAAHGPESHAVGSFADRQFKYLLVAPAVFLILLIGLFPLVQLLITSFQNITMFDEDRSFQGALNFARLLDDRRLWQAILHTVLFTAVALPIQMLLGLLMAQLFLEPLPGRQVFVALLVLPTVIAPIVAGSTWRLLLDQRFGPVNQIIGWFAGPDFELLWNLDPLFVWPAILLAEVWQWTPFMFLIFLAALANVDRSLVEAAQIDGAGFWTVFFRVSLPIIRPVLIVALIIRGLDLIRLFDLVWILTGGGPGTMTETISIYAYQMAFREFEISYSAAIALLVIVLLSLAVIVALRRVEIAR